MHFVVISNDSVHMLLFCNPFMTYLCLSFMNISSLFTQNLLCLLKNHNTQCRMSSKRVNVFHVHCNIKAIFLSLCFTTMLAIYCRRNCLGLFLHQQMHQVQRHYTYCHLMQLLVRNCTAIGKQAKKPVIVRHILLYRTGFVFQPSHLLKATSNF